MVSIRSMINRCSNSERGFALVLVLVILMTLTVVGVGVITSTSTNAALSRNYEINMQARNMAEIGARVAYREFINTGFLQTTHTLDMAQSETGEDLLPTSLANYYIDSDGSYVWEWDSSKGYDPMWDTDKRHGFKFRVYYTSNFSFIIESEGWYDKIRKRTRAQGEIETMFQFSYFASRDLGEFTRGASQEIRGKVHANGHMYIRPTGATLRINSSSVTATGNMIRSRDAWGRPDTSGACEITKNSEGSGIWIEMEPGSPRGSEGLAFDSYNANWTDKTVGAKALWGGVVRDKVPYKSPPPVQNLNPGEYYDQEAQLHINNTTHSTEPWCSQVTFWNWNEQRWITAWEIDFADLISGGADYSVVASDGATKRITILGNHETEYNAGDAVYVVSCFTRTALNNAYTVVSAVNAGGNTNIIVSESVTGGATDGILFKEATTNDWPSNGLIYCDVPVRLKNTAKLQNKLMVSSCRTIYTLGDFNTIEKKGCAIMTVHRIYHLSGIFSDAQSTNSKNRSAVNTRINAALVDGAPTVDEYNWADRDDNNRYDWSGIVRYNPESPKTAAGYNDPNNSGDPWANCDDLVENWSGKTLTKFGSVVHLDGAVMCANLDNSGIQTDELAWVQKTGYNPPVRVYMYDPDLSTPAGQPPYTPLIGHITSWAPY
ncbi:MAG: pilus assembly PilX N-terminal domain-containing protein [Candidatus Latescibacteria bacterium]|nr:pilus assembly PilX N-terminal domain-containing protein [Candidatus Latescibacterota bacterium]